MADLPTINDLGAMPSGRSGRIVARFDTTPIGEGLEGLGNSVTGFANAVGQAQQERDAQAQAQARAQAQAQQTQAAYAANKANEGTLQAALASQLTAATAPPHADDYIAGYQQRSNALLDTMPPDLREHYAGRMEADGHGLYRQAVLAGQGAIKKAATASVADATSAASAQADVAGAHPDPAARLQMLQGAISDGATAIALTPGLGDDEKAQATAALRTAVQTRFARALPPADAVTLAPDFARESTVDRIVRLLNDPASPPPPTVQLAANGDLVSGAISSTATSQLPTAASAQVAASNSAVPLPHLRLQVPSAAGAADGGAPSGQPSAGGASATPNIFSQYGAGLAAMPHASSAPTGVDWDFVRRRESGTDIGPTMGYVPPQKDGTPSPTSGVTIAGGFDIGQHSEADLRALGLPEDLVARLAPYTKKSGQPNFAGQAAQDALTGPDGSVLVITTEQAEQINDAVATSIYNTLARNYNRASTTGVQFQQLPEDVQTAVVDFAYQHGPSFGVIAKRSAEEAAVWDDVTNGRWQAAYDYLNTVNDGYSSRRQPKQRGC